MADVADMLKELAGAGNRNDRVKTAIQRAADMAGLSYWRTFDLWYRKARRVEQFEVDQVADALQAKRDRDARNEFRDLKSRLARLESLLVQTDAEFHRDAIDMAREQMRGLGVPSGALARRTVK